MMKRMTKANEDPYERKGRPGWWVTVRDEHGERHRLLATRESGQKGRDLAVIFRSKYVDRVKMLKEGLVNHKDIEVADNRTRSTAAALQEMLQQIRDRDKSPGYVEELESWVTRFFTFALKREGGGAQRTILTFAELNRKDIKRWLTSLLKAGLSHKTHNHALGSLRTFCLYAVDCHYIAESPVDGIAFLDPLEDRRAASRPLTHDQLTDLLTTVKGRRKLYYLFGSKAGLRWEEISRLTWRNLDIEKGWIRLSSGSTKKKRADELPIHADLMSELVKYLAEVTEDNKGVAPLPTDKLFKAAPTRITWLRDLRNAGIIRIVRDGIKAENEPEEVDCGPDVANCWFPGYRDDRGRILGQQCLRKTFGTHLASVEKNMAVVAKLMRHTDPKMTLELYTDARILDLRGSMDKLGGSLVPLLVENSNSEINRIQHDENPKNAKTA